jgi:tetratricopeptide (TPR) repeat protein
VAYAGQGENQLAVSALKQGLDLKKSLNKVDAEVLITLGRSQGQLRQYADGLESCRRAIQLQPNADVLAGAHRCLGRIYGESGQRENAIAAFREAIRVYPDDANAHFELASAYTRVAQYQNAVASFKQALRLSPNEPDGHYSLGLTYVLMGSKGEALQVYRTLQKLDMELAKELAAEINRMK